MPRADQYLTANSTPLRLLNFGNPKTRKTWWSVLAAAAGYNVILLKGEDNIQFLKNIPVDVLKRIFVVDVTNTSKKAVMAMFVTRFLRGDKFIYDGTSKEIVLNADNLEHEYWLVDRDKLGMNDVVVCDTWTKLCWSLMWTYALENHIDLADAERQEEGGYGWSGRLATWMLEQFTSLPCHVIVNGHANTWQKTKRIKGNDGKWQIVEQGRMRTQPSSTSGPHGQSLAKNFSDVLFFDLAGANTVIDTTPSDERDGGSTTIAPGVYPFDPGKPGGPSNLQFAQFVLESRHGLRTNVEPPTAFQYYPPGELPPAKFASMAKPTFIQPSAASLVAQAGPQTILQATTAAAPAKLTISSLGDSGEKKPGTTSLTALLGKK